MESSMNIYRIYVLINPASRGDWLGSLGGVFYLELKKPPEQTQSWCTLKDYSIAILTNPHYRRLIAKLKNRVEALYSSTLKNKFVRESTFIVKYTLCFHPGFQVG